MNDLEQAKLQRFVNDEMMADTVYAVLLDSFLQDRPSQDVYVLAASRLAVDFLKQGWKELQKFKEKGDEPSPVSKQIGL